MNNLLKIPSGTKIIIDTNILVYFALADKKYGPSCREFISRIQSGVISGFIPTIVLHELAHTLMMAELIVKGYGKNRSEAIQYLKRFHEHIHDKNIRTSDIHPVHGGNNSGDVLAHIPIIDTWIWMDKIHELNCTIIYEKNSTIYHSFQFSQKYGLLAKDAYIAAFAKSYGLLHIATNDNDFEVLTWLTSWKPERKE